MVKKSGLLFVISGPSGVGKGTLCANLLKADANIWFSISCATRSPRAGEVDGREYYFTSEAEFMKMVERGEMLEYARVHDHYYGTPKTVVEERLNAGYDVILDIDVQGGLQVMKKAAESTGIFVLPPSYDALKSRLIGRKTDSEEQIKLRLINARTELSAAKDYDFLLINDKVEDALERLRAIMVSRHMAYSHQKPYLDALLKEYEEEHKNDD